MLPSVGPMELALIFLILLLIFGPTKLVDLARSLGAAIHEFRRGVEMGEEAAAAGTTTRRQAEASSEGKPVKEEKEK